jgi:IclR family acetate operon transcriptional repressor
MLMVNVSGQRIAAAALRGRPRTREVHNVVRALDRGLAVLETIGEQPGNQSDVARRVGLSVSTTYRLLETLRARGFVTRNDEDGVYEVGVRAFSIGAVSGLSRSLTLAADPVMRKLVATFNESVNLAVLDEDAAVYIHQVTASRVVQLFTRIGARVPLYCTGVGKVLIAWQSPARIDGLLRGDLHRYTPNTRTDLSDIALELARVRQDGSAVDDEEREAGVRCVAAPIRDRAGEVVGAVSVSAPAGRLADDLRPKLTQAVVASSRMISQRLGWHMPDGPAPTP